MFKVLLGDNRDTLKTLPDGSVHCCVTSPPYWGLRDYGTAEWEGGDAECDHAPPDDAPNGNKGQPQTHAGRHSGDCRKCGAKRIDRQLGLEKTPEEYVANMVAVFREVRRVLRDDGTLFLNLGDSYNGSGGVGGAGKQHTNGGSVSRPDNRAGWSGLKQKDLVGIPWMTAFALRADGWYLRSDIIWCLSGGAWVYARTQKGDMPVMVRDLARLKAGTVQLWNGAKWTPLLGMSKSKRRGDELEIVLRSGERIACTPTHRFPANLRRGDELACGVYAAGDLRPGDCLVSCRLPEPDEPRDCAIDFDAAWLAGLYLAEGSRSGGKIQIAGHAKEESRWHRVEAIARKFGGSATRTVDGNNMSIRVYGKILNAIVDELVSGRTAKDKGFAPAAWRYSDGFIAAMLDGYLSGDGAKDGTRWRLGFCRNYNLERDLRTACARLGYCLTLKLATVKYQGRNVPTFRGEIRMERSGHHNERDRNEIVAIRKSRCREVYDLGVADDPHVFALASGVLTHNSKPNPMPESVTDRPTKAHEYLFLLTKSPRYFYDAEAIKEQLPGPLHAPGNTAAKGEVMRNDFGTERMDKVWGTASGRNRRSVWTVATAPYSEAHFATYPPKLIEPCIKAGTSEKGCCPNCGAQWERVVEREQLKRERPNDYTKRTGADGTGNSCANSVAGVATTTTGWRPTCNCGGDPVPCTIIDPHGGSGTTAGVANALGRRAILCELSDEYAKLIPDRVRSIVDSYFGREDVKTTRPATGQRALFEIS